MLPMPKYLFDQVWLLVVMALFLFGPFVFVYCAVRFFRDLRAIRVSMARIALVAARFNAELDELPADKPDGYREPILNSMFGR
jgi:hypothetical protein